VRVEDKWLIASVAAGFEGNQLVGRLLPLDAAASHSLLERIRRIEPDPSALLPYEFNGVDGSASDQRIRYMGAACVPSSVCWAYCSGCAWSAASAGRRGEDDSVVTSAIYRYRSRSNPRSR